MYKSQRGLLPGVIRLLGLIILLCMFILDIQILVMGDRDNISTGFSIPSILLGLLGVTAPLLILAGMCLCMFPGIRLIPEGIKYSCLFTTGLIKWSEVGDLVRLKRGTVLIVINRSGSTLFNGLYFQSLYNLFVGHEHPVIFLLPSLDQRDTILSEIMRNSAVKGIKDRDDPYA